MNDTELTIVVRSKVEFQEFIENYGEGDYKRTILMISKKGPGPKKKFQNVFNDLHLLFLRNGPFFATPYLLSFGPLLTEIESFLNELVFMIASSALLDPKISLHELNETLAGIRLWRIICDTLVKPFEHGNQFLTDLPNSPNENTFFAFVKELNPFTTLKLRHPFNERQLSNQRTRPTKDLLSSDPVDPASGRRYIRADDQGNAPGSGIYVNAGHHRLYEVYRRYLRGEIAPNELFLLERV